MGRQSYRSRITGHTSRCHRFIVPSQILDAEIPKWRFGLPRRFQTLIRTRNSAGGVPDAVTICECPNYGAPFPSLSICNKGYVAKQAKKFADPFISSDRDLGTERPPILNPSQLINLKVCLIAASNPHCPWTKSQIQCYVNEDL
jgi:hypothetical protein